MQKIKLNILIYIIFGFLLSIEQDTIRIDEDTWKASIIPSINMTSFVQYDNNKPLKGLSLSLMKLYWYDEFKEAHNEDRISNRNRAFWWSLFLYFYTIMDGYMDANLDDSKDEIKKIEGE